LNGIMRSTARAAFTLVELLVVIAIIGILVGLLLPAVQAAREAARAMQCQNNLHQLGLATHLFHDSFKAFPPARYQPRPDAAPDRACGGEETTWLVRIMPFLEQQQAEARWDYSVPYAAHAEEVRQFNLAAYCCPARRSAANAIGTGIVARATTTWIILPCGCRVPGKSSGATQLSGAVGDYGGNHGDLSPGAAGLPSDFYYGGNGTGVIISSHARCNDQVPQDWVDKIRFQDVSDGLSNTIAAGEMHVPLGKLGQSPEDAFIFNGDHVFNSTRVGGPTVPIVQNNLDEGNGLISWGSWHAGVCHVVLSDGSVRGFAKTMDTQTLGYLCNRRDGHVNSHGD